jgi:hypothetical protein
MNMYKRYCQEYVVAGEKIMRFDDTVGTKNIVGKCASCGQP